MKGIASTLEYFFREGSKGRRLLPLYRLMQFGVGGRRVRRPGSRNVIIVLRFFFALLALIALYTFAFLQLMRWEGKDYSWIDGFYWVLVTMSTLGFGDIVFESDLGRIFSVLVLFSGVVALLILLPFVFIEFFYAPWMEAQSAARAPRTLNKNISGHIVLTHHDSISTSLIHKLEQYQYPYSLLVPDLDEALRLHDAGLHVVLGELDDPQTYRNIRVDRAALVATTANDVVNTNVTFTIREQTTEVPIISTANSGSSAEILKLAGSTHVVQLGEMMGRSLARRTIGSDAMAHEIGRFGDLVIAEATASGTPLIGTTLQQSRLRELVGVTVVGVWERGRFQPAGSDTVISPHTVLVIAGSPEQLKHYDELFCIYHIVDAPVVIIGGGRVGRATGRALAERKIDYRIVEKLPERIRNPEHYIQGSASELEVVERAGIMEAPTVVITSHEDDTNIYLTLFYRKLRPDIQIISRATLERNISTLHRAGADFVMSYASMGANTIFNLLQRSDFVMLAEGLNVIRVTVNEALSGKALADVPIREESGCSVVAVRRNGEMAINPDPSLILEAGVEMILIGTGEAEARFLELYGDKIEGTADRKAIMSRLT